MPAGSGGGAAGGSGGGGDPKKAAKEAKKAENAAKKAAAAAKKLERAAQYAGKGGGGGGSGGGGNKKAKAKPATEELQMVSPAGSPCASDASFQTEATQGGENGRYYVTTAISYTNGMPHMGHAYEALTTDAIARWHRIHGRKTFFLTGTDEHGQKIANSAEKDGLQPIDICDKVRLTSPFLTSRERGGGGESALDASADALGWSFRRASGDGAQCTFSDNPCSTAAHPPNHPS